MPVPAHTTHFPEPVQRSQFSPFTFPVPLHILQSPDPRHTVHFLSFSHCDSPSSGAPARKPTLFPAGSRRSTSLYQAKASQAVRGGNSRTPECHFKRAPREVWERSDAREGRIWDLAIGVELVHLAVARLPGSLNSLRVHRILFEIWIKTFGMEVVEAQPFGVIVDDNRMLSSINPAGREVAQALA